MALATLPFLGTLITYFFPAWRVTSLITITSNDTSITSNATSQVIWEGLLMNCLTQRMARMQCDSSNMILASPQVLLAVRVLFITVLFVSLWGFCMAAPGRRCGEYSEDGEEIEVGKARAEFTNGIPFIVWGLLIRITWVTVNIAQGRDRYSNQAGEMEMVASLYMGFITATLLFGVRFLCSPCPLIGQWEDEPGDMEASVVPYEDNTLQIIRIK